MDRAKVVMGVLLRRERRLFLISFTILFLSFFLNIFGVGYSQGWFTTFQQDSDSIVKKSVECKFSGEVNYGGGITLEKGASPADMSKVGCSEEKYKPYDSQFGLQARLISLFAPTSTDVTSRVYFILVECALSVALAALFSLLIIKIKRSIRASSAYATLALLSVSVWVVAYAGSLYWFSIFMFLPFVFSFICYPVLHAGRGRVVFYSILFLLFFLKLLNGYEHISTVLMSAFVPIIFYEKYYHKVPGILRLWRQALTVLVCGVFALGLAMFVNTASLASYYGSWGEAFERVASRAGDRSAGGLAYMQPYVVSGFQSTSPEIYSTINNIYDLDALEGGEKHPLKYAFASILNYLFLPVISLPFVLREPIASVIQSFMFFVFLTIVSLAFLRKIAKTARERRLIEALRASFIIGLAGSLSWLVLMPGHAYPHAHLNGIVMYIPTLIFSYIILGLAMVAVYKKIRK